MKLGAEHREQVYFLLGLVVAAGYTVYANFLQRHPDPPSAPYRVPARHRARTYVGQVVDVGQVVNLRTESHSVQASEVRPLFPPAVRPVLHATLQPEGALPPGAIL
jgi:hypothetical protein